MVKAIYDEALSDLVGNDIYTVSVLENELDFEMHILAKNGFDAVNTVNAFVNGDK